MKVTTEEIRWHDCLPVFSLDFQMVSENRTIQRLATGGADKSVRIWNIQTDVNGSPRVEFLSNLSRHTKPVNCVRFSPNGETLASAGDEYVIVLWRRKQMEMTIPCFNKEDENNKELWTVVKILSGHVGDIYDLAWSPDNRLLLSGSVDSSAIVWDIEKGHLIHILKEARGYVQGVTWDPAGKFFVCHSNDKSCRVYCSQTFRKVFNQTKLNLAITADNNPTPGPARKVKMYHDETMNSFFRRPVFTPGGELLFVPAGVVETDEGTTINATYIFTRKSLNKPVAYLPSPDKPTIAVRSCPLKFKLRQKNSDEVKAFFNLPYRLVYAVASETSVLIYDTQQFSPIGYVSGIHYEPITDISWSRNGKILAISSADCYCSFVTFAHEEIGTVVDDDPVEGVSDPTPLTSTPPTSTPTTHSPELITQPLKTTTPTTTTTTIIITTNSDVSHISTTAKQCSQQGRRITPITLQSYGQTDTIGTKASVTVTSSPSVENSLATSTDHKENNRNTQTAAATVNTQPRRIQLTTLSPLVKTPPISDPIGPQLEQAVTSVTTQASGGLANPGPLARAAVSTPIINPSRRIQLTTLSPKQIKVVPVVTPLTIAPSDMPPPTTTPSKIAPPNITPLEINISKITPEKVTQSEVTPPKVNPPKSSQPRRIELTTLTLNNPTVPPSQLSENLPPSQKTGP